MNVFRTMLSVVCLLAGMLLVSHQSLGQYGGGGMGGGGMGRGMGGGMGGNQYGQQGASRPSIPNIAGDMAQKETKWLKENLNLDKDQAKAVKKLNNEYASEQQDAIKDIIGTGGAGGRPSPEAMKQVREMMLMLNEEKEDKLKPILTPEQWTTYQSKKEVMQKEIGGIRPPGPKTTPPASSTPASSTL